KARDIVDMAKPGDTRLAIPRFRFPLSYRSRVGRVRRASDQKLGIWDALTQQAMRGDECADAFVVQQSADKPKSRRSAGLIEWFEAIDVNSRPRNERNVVLCNAEREQCSPIVVILHQGDILLTVDE